MPCQKLVPKSRDQPSGRRISVALFTESRTQFRAMPAATMEFASFRSMNDFRQAAARPATRTGSEAWIPPGTNPSHAKSRGLPSRKELEVAAAESEAQARSEAVIGVVTRLDGVDAALERLDHRLDRLETDYEQHVISHQAASALIARRLSELGLAG